MRPRMLFEIVLTLCLVVTVSAEWVNLGGPPGTPPIVRLLTDSPTQTTFEIELFGFELSDTIVQGAVYSEISLPGHALCIEAGYPALPRVVGRLIIPDMDLMAIELLDAVTCSMSVHPVLPSRGIIMRSEDPDTVPFVFSTLYETGGSFPDVSAELGRPYILRDFRGLAAKCYPFMHDPRSGQLVIRRTMTVRVYSAGLDTVNVKTTPRPGSADPAFISLYNNHFLNYPGSESRYELLKETGDMLIISADSYTDNPDLQDFVSWKMRRGHAVDLQQATSVAPTGFDLIQYVNQAYSENLNLAFVVLVGDGAEQSSGTCVAYPRDSGSQPLYPADNRCVMVGGDGPYPDLIVSRIAAENDDELHRELDRLMKYERYPSGGEWYWRSLGIASAEGGDYLLVQDLLSLMLNSGYMEVDGLYYTNPNNPVTPSEIGEAINYGRSWVFYSGHGTPENWYFLEPSYIVVFSNADMGELENGWQMPFIYSVACRVGTIEPEHNPCFAKTWISTMVDETNPRGAVGFFGASNFQPWVPPTLAMAETCSLLCLNDATTVGGLCFDGLCFMLSEYEPYIPFEVKQTAECWLLHGDCSMQVRGPELPQTITVTHPTHAGYYGDGQNSVPYEISGIDSQDEVTVSLVLEHNGEEELLATSIWTGSGSYSTEFVGSEDGDLHITVSGPTVIPYEGTISLQETYSGVQSGNQTVHGSFLIDNDVCIPNGATLDLERYPGSSGATFEIAQNCQGTSYGFNSGECEIVVKGGATLYAKGIHFNGEDSPSGTYYGTFSLPESGATLTLDGSTVEGGQNGVAMGGGSQLVRIMGYGGFLECTGSAIKSWSSGEVEVTAPSGFTNCDKGIELSGSGNITLTIAGSSSQMNGCFEGIYVRESPVVTASITGANFNGCGKGIRIETGHSATAFTISDCQFVTNGYAIQRTGIEVVGTGDNGPTANVFNSTFLSGGDPDFLDRGVVYRDGAKGTISNCTFACGEEKYRAVECRSGNDLVVLMNNEFLGDLPCPGPFSMDNRGVYALGGAANSPRIHANYLNKYCCGVSVIGGSLADLGTEEDTGDNEFWSNCCDLQYWGRPQVPPGGTLYAQGNCWNGYANAAVHGILCGSWVDWIEWDPGWNCEGREFVPPSLPTAWALHVAGPNPSGQSVEILLQLPEAPQQRQVRIEVMDLAGRVLRTLPLQEPQAGSYRLHWDGRGSDGTEVPSGVYVCRATVDGRVLSDKAILLREEP